MMVESLKKKLGKIASNLLVISEVIHHLGGLQSTHEYRVVSDVD